MTSREGANRRHQYVAAAMMLLAGGAFTALGVYLLADRGPTPGVLLILLLFGLGAVVAGALLAVKTFYNIPRSPQIERVEGPLRKPLLTLIWLGGGAVAAYSFVAPNLPVVRGLGGAVALVFGLSLVLSALLHVELKWRLMNRPTATARSVPMGLVELKGRVRSAGSTLESPNSGRECVYYQQGTGVLEDVDGVPFYLEDDSGRVLVDPEDAHVRVEHTLEGGSTEWCLPVDSDVYVLGEAMESDDQTRETYDEDLVVGADEDTPVFYISDFAESRSVTAISLQTIVTLLVGVFLTGVGGYVLLWV